MNPSTVYRDALLAIAALKAGPAINIRTAKLLARTALAQFCATCGEHVTGHPTRACRLVEVGEMDHCDVHHRFQPEGATS